MTGLADAVAPGVRGRLGVIQPAPGLMLEAEWSMLMPPGVAFPVTRLPLYGGTHADYAAMEARAPDAAVILANAQANVIGYACGIGSLYRGPDAERRLMAELSQAAGGIPVLGMAATALAEIRRLGARRITLLTPYPAAVNQLVQAYVEASGLVVAGIHALPVGSAIEAATLRPEQTIEAAVASIEAMGTDLLWIPCSNVRAIELCEPIRQRTGSPCICSNQALLGAMLAHL